MRRDKTYLEGTYGMSLMSKQGTCTTRVRVVNCTSEKKVSHPTMYLGGEGQCLADMSPYNF